MREALPPPPLLLLLLVVVAGVGGDVVPEVAADALAVVAAALARLARKLTRPAPMAIRSVKRMEGSSDERGGRGGIEDREGRADDDDGLGDEARELLFLDEEPGWDALARSSKESRR